jgi:hypothetical protein
MIRRLSHDSDFWHCGSCVACLDWYNGVTLDRSFRLPS